MEQEKLSREVTVPEGLKPGLRVAVAQDSHTGEFVIALTPTHNDVDQPSILYDLETASGVAAAIMKAVETAIVEVRKQWRAKT